MDTVVAALLGLTQAALGYPPPDARSDLPGDPSEWVAQHAYFFTGEHLLQPVGAGSSHHHGRAAIALLRGRRIRPCMHHAANATTRWPSLASAALPIAQRVAQWLADALLGQWPQLSDIAQRCQMSLRTLMRRLAAQGMSFQDLLDAA